MPQDTTNQFYRNGKHSTKASINATVCNVGVDHSVEMTKGILQGAAEELASLLGKRAAFDHLSQMCDDMAKPEISIYAGVSWRPRAVESVESKRKRSRKKPI